MRKDYRPLPRETVKCPKCGHMAKIIIVPGRTYWVCGVCLNHNPYIKTKKESEFPSSRTPRRGG